MSVKITPAAREWLARKGGVATLRFSSRHGCCGGRANIAVVEVRAPDDPTSYTRVEHAGLVLHLDPALIDRELIVDAEGFLGFKKLFVHCVLAKMPD